MRSTSGLHVPDQATGPFILALVIEALDGFARRFGHRETGHGNRTATKAFSGVLDKTGRGETTRSTESVNAAAGIDPEDVPSRSRLGIPAYCWRIEETGYRSSEVYRREIYDPTEEPIIGAGLFILM